MKIYTKLNFFLETLLLFWFFVVYSAYIYFHPNPLSFIPVIFGGLLLVGLWYSTVRPLKNDLDFKINTKLWKFALFLLIITLNTAVFIRLLGNTFTENLDFIPFLITELDVIINLLIKVLFLSFLVLLSLGIGKKLFDIFKFEIENKKEEFIFSFGLGFLAINYFAFFLTALGWLYFWPSLALIAAIAFFSRKQIKYFIDNFLKAEFRFNISADFMRRPTDENLKSWVWIIVGIFFMIGFLITFRLFPYELDDLGAYFNVPQLYAYYHRLVPFYNSPTLIFCGIGVTFYALINILLAPHFVFHLTWLFLIFILASVYIFTSKFFSKKTALITILLAAFVPWNYFFITTQKVVFIFAFTSILALFSFFVWLNNKQPRWLYLSAIFLGYAVSLKMNGLFLIGSLAIFLFYLFIVKKISFKKCIIFSSVVFLFFLPIIAQNVYYYKNPIPLFISSPFIKKTQTIFNQGKKITPYDIYQKTDFAQKRNIEMTLLGRQNRTKNSAFFNLFWSLWNMTVNQRGIKFLYIETCPYLLIFLPFFIFYFIKNKYYKEKNILHLAIISLIFLILWYLYGTERPWYAIAIFYFLFIFSAIALQNIKNKRYIFIIYFLIILFSLRTGTIIHFANTPNTIYLSSHKNKQLLKKQSFSKIFNFINKEIITKNKKPLILMLLDSRITYIQEGDKKIITDKLSYYWGKILRETNSLKEVKNILENQGITHILYNIESKDGLKYLLGNKPENDYKIFKEIEIFEEFKDQYLTELYCEEKKICIYEIKK